MIYCLHCSEHIFKFTHNKLYDGKSVMINNINDRKNVLFKFNDKISFVIKNCDFFIKLDNYEQSSMETPNLHDFYKTKEYLYEKKNIKYKIQKRNKAKMPKENTLNYVNIRLREYFQYIKKHIVLENKPKELTQYSIKKNDISMYIYGIKEYILNKYKIKYDNPSNSHMYFYKRRTINEVWDMFSKLQKYKSIYKSKNTYLDVIKYLSTEGNIFHEFLLTNNDDVQIHKEFKFKNIETKELWKKLDFSVPNELCTMNKFDVKKKK